MPDRNAERGGSMAVLLIEDNPGDARIIREMVTGVDISSRGVIGGGNGVTIDPTIAPIHAEPTVVHETRLADGLDALVDGRFDVVLLDLNLPDSEGIRTVEAVRRQVPSLPIVVLTGHRDRETGTDALHHGADEYLVKDEINTDQLVRSVYHAIERKVHERELERQRTRLATLASLNELVNEITHLAIESSTRDELEQLVCEHLADSRSYRSAWIGGVDPVATRAAAGDGIAARTDDREEGPAGRAIRTGELQVTRTAAGEHESPSSIAIPITYGGTDYGVLTIDTDRPDAFDAEERTVVGRLGEVIGHAIDAIG